MIAFAPGNENNYEKRRIELSFSFISLLVVFIKFSISVWLFSALSTSWSNTWLVCHAERGSSSQYDFVRVSMSISTLQVTR